MTPFLFPFPRTRSAEDGARGKRAHGTAEATSAAVPGWLTVSLPTDLRARIEQSAALAGLPPDAWVYRSLARSIDPRLGAH